MKFGIIVTDDDQYWGGEEGVGEYILKRFEERNASRDLFKVFHAITGKLPAEEAIIAFDGFLLTGSHHSVNDGFPWQKRLEQFVRVVYKTSQEFGRPRMVGICFGHQLIAKALGGRVGKNPDDAFHFGSCEIEVKEEFLNQEYAKKHFRRQSSFNIMKFHGECVIEKPELALAIGSSKQCKHEVLLYGDFILTTQGHPEYTKQEMLDQNSNIMKRIGKLDPIDIREKLERIYDGDAESCTEMVRSFLRHTNNECPPSPPTNTSSAKGKRARFHRMKTFQ